MKDSLEWWHLIAEKRYDGYSHLEEDDYYNEACYPRYLGITRRSCLEAHMVLDMEYLEQERPEHGPGGPISSSQPVCPASSTGLHHYRLGLVSERALAP